MEQRQIVLLAINILNHMHMQMLKNAAVVLLEDNIENYIDNENEADYLLLCLATNNKTHPRRISLYLENVASNYTDTEFQQNFRLSREAFHFILNKIQDIFRDKEDPIKIEKELLAVIWLLATPDSYRSVGSRVDRAKSSLSRSFFRIIDALNQIAPEVIKWPSELQRENSRMYFEQKYGIFNVIGAIDGTYVPIKVPKNQSLIYTNRKKFTAMTLQVVCNEQLLFLDCFTGYPSSVNDVRIFRKSDLYERVQAAPLLYFPNAEIILGDKAYPSLPWLKPPYINRGNLTAEQIEYNRVHSSARSVVERSFAHLFGRFRRLQDLNMNRLDWVPATIIAACVLHNVCLIFKDNIDEYVRQGYCVARQNALDREEAPR